MGRQALANVVWDERCNKAQAFIDDYVRRHYLPPPMRVLADALGMTWGEPLREVLRRLVARGTLTLIRAQERRYYVPTWLVEGVNGRGV